MKLLHLADVHIKNVKQHLEYKSIFNTLKSQLEIEKPDAIIICGDVADSKTQLSPEYFDLCSIFLRFLADIAKTFVICGNHDYIVSNIDRMDAISPVVNALNHPNLHFLKYSGEVSLTDNIVINHLSIFDRQNWKPISDPSKINIALYHGAISGCRLDNGWIMENGDDPISIFDGFDFAMLGDIHLSNQKLDKNGRFRYAGSFTQNNFGETNDKGYLIWDIKNKNDFEVRHISIPNPKPFITINLDRDLPEDLVIPDGSKVRVITGDNLSFASSKEVADLIRSKFNVESVSVIDGKYISKRSNNDFLFKKEHLAKNRQDLLLVEFLKSLKNDQETINNIIKLDKEVSGQIADKTITDDIVQFEILDLEWNNFFQFGEKNFISFKDKQGIIGIFGENQSGKSSIIDTLIYTIYGDVSKKIKKNVQVINHSADFCDGKVRIMVGNKIYTIYRKTQKIKKKLKGEEIVDAQVQVEFSVYNVDTDETLSLNGEGTQETNKNIRNTFGDIDYLLLTSVSSQFGSFQFIDERSTNRKELLGKLLKLDIFGQKYDIANKKSKDVKAMLKRYDNTDFVEQIKQNAALISKKEEEEKEIRQKVQNVESHLEGLMEMLWGQKIETIEKPKMPILSIDGLEKRKLKFIQEHEQLLKDKVEIEDKLSKLNDSLTRHADKQNTTSKHHELLKQKITLESEISSLEKELQSLGKKVELLKDVPCGDQFPSCKFIRDAFGASSQIGTKTAILVEKKKSFDKICLDVLLTQEFLKQIKTAEEDKKYLEESLDETIKGIQVFERDLDFVQKEIDEFHKHKDEIERWKKVEERNEEVRRESKKIKESIRQQEELKNSLQKNLIETNKQLGSLEEREKTLFQERTTFEKLRQEFELYEKYLECVHPNGITYSIIKQTLPIINKEINALLSNVIDFSIHLSNEDDRLEVYIQKPGQEPTLIEGCSGAERTMASLGIRLALLFISSIPRSDKFILDEPALWLDKQKFQGFLELLDLIKVHFHNIVLITHLDELKEVANHTLQVSVVNKYSVIN